MHAEGEQIAEAVQNSTAAAAERTKAIARMRDELLRQRDAHLEALCHEEGEMKRQREAAEERELQATRLLNTYRERLGFAITRDAAQTVRMTFLLDEADPNREFAFTLGVASAEGESGYVVHDCRPAVPELESLLVDLNNDVESPVALPRFVCSMRRAFLRLSRCGQEKA
jgi:hypothetical protein